MFFLAAIPDSLNPPFDARSLRDRLAHGDNNIRRPVRLSRNRWGRIALEFRPPLAGFRAAAARKIAHHRRGKRRSSRPSTAASKLQEVEPCRGARWVRTVLASVLPEILEPIRRHLGISNCVHDIFMAHIVLEGSGVMPIVGELVTSGVPEHVG